MPVDFSVACPFFFPIARHDAELWPFRRRLPLGDGFRGHCMAPGHEGAIPADATLADCCNLGYGRCPSIPASREADAVHFSVASDRDGVIALHWVLVKDHAAARFGKVHYERSSHEWRDLPPDPNLQQMAQCYLESYLARRGELQPQPACK